MFDNDLFDLFDWDKKNYKFNRNEKDMHPYSIYNKEDKVIIVHNVLGLNKKDLKLTINSEGNSYQIHIEGKTKDKVSGTEYSINSKFAVDPSTLKLDSIAAAMENGLLYITIQKKDIPKDLKFTNINII
jgi:HSP20 family molecular chaperone IbpA